MIFYPTPSLGLLSVGAVAVDGVRARDDDVGVAVGRVHAARGVDDPLALSVAPRRRHHHRDGPDVHAAAEGLEEGVRGLLEQFLKIEI